MADWADTETTASIKQLSPKLYLLLLSLLNLRRLRLS